jgi:hypothetical protein
MDTGCDIRDAEERAAIAAVLAELPADHAARIAYDDHADTMQLARLVDRQDLADRLAQAFVGGYTRMRRARGGPFRP